MRVKYFSISILVAAAVMIMGLRVAPLQASQYLGEVTWNGSSSGGSFVMKAGLSKVGGSYYEIQGQMQDEYGIAIFSGGGVLAGNNLMLTVTATSDDQEAALVVRINLDKGNLNGNFWLKKAITYIPPVEFAVPLFPAGNYDGVPPHPAGPFPPLNYPDPPTITISLEQRGNLPTTGSLTVVGNPISLAPGTTSSLPLLLE